MPAARGGWWLPLEFWRRARRLQLFVVQGTPWGLRVVMSIAELDAMKDLMQSLLAFMVFVAGNESWTESSIVVTIDCQAFGTLFWVRVAMVPLFCIHC